MKQLFSVMLLCAVVVFSSCSKDDDENETIAVTGVSVNKTTLSLVVDATETLIATITPDNATNKNVQWKSSNATIATVSADGIVTAKAAGNATITVTTEDGGKTATCVVTVVNTTIAVTQVTLNKNTLELTEGKDETLTATVTPTDATDKTVTWTSSKPETATVDATGKVIAIKAGTTTITATAGTQTAQCVVTVKAPTFYGWYKNNETATSFVISSVDELKAFANLVNGTDKTNSGESGAIDFTGKTVTLKAATTFNLNNEKWIPIGTGSNNAFKGTFDGNNNSITGLKVSNGLYLGLFGWVSNALLKNIKTDGGIVSGAAASCAGGVVGRPFNSTVENCNSSVTVSGQKAGGVVGSANQSNIKGCYASGNVTAIDGTSDVVTAGGVVGYISISGSVKACYYITGTATGGKASNGNWSCTGGVVGCSSTPIEVRNCYSLGSVVAGTGGSSIYTGGVIGYSEQGSALSHLLYVSGKGATSGVGEKNTDADYVKAITAADKLAENITWLNTDLPGSIGWSFNADGTLKKAN